MVLQTFSFGSNYMYVYSDRGYPKLSTTIFTDWKLNNYYYLYIVVKVLSWPHTVQLGPAV